MTPEMLVEKALQAKQHAYVPYSKFAVGAALLASDGDVFTGCNIENSSYGLTVCAERVALFTAVARGKREFKALAVVAGTDEFCSPCGACRQVLAEFGQDMTVYLANINGKYREMTVRELLPTAFSLNVK